MFLRLARAADIVVESFRPGVSRKLGIDYETLRAINPGIVYCAITGYGQTGPLARAAGHDLNYIGLAGVLDQIGVDGGQPAKLYFNSAPAHCHYPNRKVTLAEASPETLGDASGRLPGPAREADGPVVVGRGEIWI